MAPKVKARVSQAQVIQLTRQIIDSAGAWELDALNTTNFLDACDRVREVVKSWPDEQIERFKPYFYALRELRDDFAAFVESDPLMLYQPAHEMMEGYHRSQALTRYIRAPNRVSKTQGAVCDAAWLQRGIHPHRKSPAWPVSVAVIIGSFSKAAHGTWIPKLKDGETGNVLSPLFPEAGRWFYKWDTQKYILTLACPMCAKAGTNGSCRHAKSRWMLFSAESDVLAVAGSQHGILLIDEQIPEEFYTEGVTRLDTVAHSSCTVTETPLGGKGFWTHKRLTKAAKKNVKDDRGIPLVTLHTCSRYDAKMTPEWKIKAREAMMTDQEAEARIYGRPAAWHEAVIFDNMQISGLIEEAQNNPAPQQGRLLVWSPNTKEDAENDRQRTEPAEKISGANTEDILKLVRPSAEVHFHPAPVGDESPELRVYERPVPFGQYVIGADVSQGLTGRDPSCAQVGKLVRKGLDVYIEQVAKWHGWVNSLVYGPQLYKMALYYNNAPIVIERNGPGDATVQELKKLGCWLLFRDVAQAAQTRMTPSSAFGVQTNVRTKGIYVSALQNYIWHKERQIRRLHIRDLDCLDELGSFGQELTQSGMSFRFRGASGTADDAVMSWAILCYAVDAFGLYNMGTEAAQEAALREAERETPLNDLERSFWKKLKHDDARRKMQRAIDG